MSNISMLSAAIARWENVSPTVRGILFMAASTVGFAVMHTMIRHISTDLHTFQIVFFRNFFGLLVFLPMFMRYGVQPFKTQHLPRHLLRAGLNIIAMSAFFYALSITPISRVTALAFSAPLFTAVLSVFILKEKIRLHRWSAILFGFVGALIILRPGVIPLDLGSMLVLLSAFAWGITMIVIKILSRTDSAMTITSYVTLLLAIFALGPALWVWRPLDVTTLLWLVAIGITGTLAQVALAQSLKEGETTAVLPFDFLKLIWVSMIAYWLFGEVADLWTWIGAAVIISSGIYVAHREKIVKQREANKND